MSQGDGAGPARERDGGARLEPMATHHLDEVAQIEQRIASGTWTRGVFEAELERDDRHYLVAMEDDAVVGYGGLMVIVDEVHITTLGVREDRRRRGTAGRLVAALLAEGCRRGAVAATLEVRATNQAAQDLYRRFGFAPVGARRRYYTDTGEDAIVMWLHDLQATDLDAPDLHTTDLDAPVLHTSDRDRDAPGGDPRDRDAAGASPETGRADTGRN